MSDFDVSIEDQIEALHAEAEELRDRSKHWGVSANTAERLQMRAVARVKQAARLRAQAGEE